jgi:hypothetical protein
MLIHHHPARSTNKSAMTTEDNKGTGPLNFGSFDINIVATKAIKQFFYQVLGIYFPGGLLILYLLFFSDNGDLLNNILERIPKIFTDNAQTIQSIRIILVIVVTIVIGEAINTVTSNISLLSPVRVSLTAKLKYIFAGKRISTVFLSFSKPEIGFSKREPKWPIWLNETYYPVSFAIFDREFLSKIDSDKKPLAGKLGWMAFYRNLSAVFFIICIMSSFFDLKVSFITLVLAAIFYLGYKSQKSAYKSIFWNAYRRNELEKSLEAKYGDLSLSLGIDDKYKKQASYYILDKWFLAVESARRVISSSLLSKAEEEYRDTYGEDKRSGKPKRIRKPRDYIVSAKDYIVSELEERQEKQTRDELIKASTDWNNGDYEIVMRRSLDVILNLKERAEEELKDSKDEIDKIGKKKEKELEQKEKTLEEKKKLEDKEKELEQKEKGLSKYWKFIKGVYIFEDALFTQAAFEEIKISVTNWLWTYGQQPNNGEELKTHLDHTYTENTKNQNTSSYATDVHGSRVSIHNEHEDLQNLLWQSADNFSHTASHIMNTIKKLNSCKHDAKFSPEEEKYCFGQLNNVFVQLGGYEYENAIKESEELSKEVDKKMDGIKTYNPYTIGRNTKKHVNAQEIGSIQSPLKQILSIL